MKFSQIVFNEWLGLQAAQTDVVTVRQVMVAQEVAEIAERVMSQLVRGASPEAEKAVLSSVYFIGFRSKTGVTRLTSCTYSLDELLKETRGEYGNEEIFRVDSAGCVYAMASYSVSEGAYHSYGEPEKLNVVKSEGQKLYKDCVDNANNSGSSNT